MDIDTKFIARKLCFLQDNGLQEAGWSHKAAFIVEREQKALLSHLYHTSKQENTWTASTVKGSPSFDFGNLSQSV